MHYFIVDLFPTPWHFSLHFINTRKSFFKRTTLRKNRFMTKCFFDNAKLVTKSISIYCFLSNPGPKFTPSSNHFDTGETLIITSSVTKDVYIRPCISLIRYHRQINTSKPGLFTRILVIRNAVFLIITGG